MKISSIETFTSSQICIVKVTTEDGRIGYGQPAPYHANITALVLHQQVAHLFLGAELNSYKEIAALAERAIIANYKFPWSYICRAVCGVETALWDLFGKKEGKSVTQLIGGTVRPIEIYGSSMRRDISPQDEAKRLVKLQDEKGIKAFKIRIGDGFGQNQDAYPGRTEENVATVSKSLEAATSLYVDANSAFTPEKAIEVGQMLQEYGVVHYEEPCPFPELEWTKQVTEALDINVTGGEQDNDMGQWKRMIRMKAVNVVQPDICYIGGLSRALEVARLADQAGLVCTPHAANLSMVTIFTAHLIAAIPNAGPFMEYSIENDIFSSGLFTKDLEVQDGAFIMPEGPGWGVEIRPDWLAKAEYAISK